MTNWIKCSDREHPDLIMDESGEFAESESVLVNVKNGRMVSAYFQELYDMDGGGVWKRTWIDSAFHSEFDLGWQVTHWQPLPEAPNED